MSISITEVRKNYQFGVGTARKTEDLPAFGWKLMTIGRWNGNRERDVAARRFIKFGTDPIITEMEARYFAEYADIERDIRRRYIIRMVLALLFGIPSLIVGMMYILSGFYADIAAKTLAMDTAIKSFLRYAGTEASEKPMEFLPEALAGNVVLAFRFVLLAIGAICLIAIIVNTVLYCLKMSDPLRFYSRSATRINDCINRAKERQDYLRAQELLQAPQQHGAAPTYGTTPIACSVIPAVAPPTKDLSSAIATETIPADKGLPAYTSYRIPVSISVGDSRVMGTVRVPRGLNMLEKEKQVRSEAACSEEKRGEQQK